MAFMYLSDELPSHGKVRKINIEHLFEKKKTLIIEIGRYLTKCCTGSINA
jgi:hypothetical protein